MNREMDETVTVAIQSEISMSIVTDRPSRSSQVPQKEFFENLQKKIGKMSSSPGGDGPGKAAAPPIGLWAARGGQEGRFWASHGPTM